MSNPQLKQLRDTAYKRQGGLCYWCDEPMLRNAGNDQLCCTADHLIRSADGGKTIITNIVAAHAICNSARHRPPRKRHDKKSGDAGASPLR